MSDLMSEAHGQTTESLDITLHQQWNIIEISNAIYLKQEESK